LVKLHDHVVAFATDTRLGLEGSASGDTRAGITAALAGAPIGADRRAILGLLSEHEGTFSNVNTWDRAVITFGFIQWTTDAAGDGTLTGVMQAVRDAAPDAYRRCFQRFGLDLGRSNGRRVFKLTLPDGSVLLAGDAARRMQTSVKHVAALSAAGLDPDVQAAQLRVAVEDKIDGMLARTVTAGGQSARLRDLLTSEYAVAVMTDRATGTGEPGTRGTAQAGFAAYMKAHPGADMSRPSDRQAAGARVLQALEALDPSRAKDYARLSHEPGSFTS
jgi:peptidoglycan endopeptidase LytF